MITLVLSSNL